MKLWEYLLGAKIDRVLTDDKGQITQIHIILTDGRIMGVGAKLALLDEGVLQHAVVAKLEILVDYNIGRAKD